MGWEIQPCRAACHGTNHWHFYTTNQRAIRWQHQVIVVVIIVVVVVVVVVVVFVRLAAVLLCLHAECHGSLGALAALLVSLGFTAGAATRTHAQG